MNLEQVVVLAGQVMALHDLVDGCDGVEEGCSISRTREAHRNEGGQRQAHRCWVEPGGEAADHPLALQSSHTLGDRGSGQSGASGKIRVGDAPLFSENVDYFEVNIVNHHEK